MSDFNHFRFVALFYDRLFAFLKPERLRQLLQVPVHGVLLDVGGGTGRVAQVLRSLADQVIVLDTSAAMLGRARDKGLLAVKGEAENLPFADDAMTRILMVDAFHHLRDQRQAAMETLRVLEPGGRLVIEEPNVEHIAVKLVALGEKVVLMRSSFQPPARVREIFEAFGGRVTIEREGFNFWAVIQVHQ
jgi:ubiquinone/menaquinone biosynthesis C-methylase UbiE